MAARTTMRSPVYMGTVRQGASSNLGAVVQSQSNTLAFTNTTAKNLFIIPANHRILEIYIDVTTAFDDTGTDLIDIGKTGTADAYLSAVSVASTGRIIGSSDNGGSGGLSGWANISTTTDVQVTATYTGQNANSANGAATITMLYCPINGNTSVTWS